MPLLETRGAASVQGFGALAASARNYIEDVFSTYLYTGNGSTQTITNGIDLSGKGGLVWGKCRNGAATAHWLFDTARGVGNYLQTQDTAAQSTQATSLTAFNSNGFSLGLNSFVNNNSSGTDLFVSWTFRKQAKFFDVVTYTGNGANRTISHNLGSVPGFIVVKKTNASGTNWNCYHRSLGATQVVNLNTTAAATTVSTVWNNTAPTSTEFTVGTGSAVNSNGDSFVAYLFAHDAGGFGASGSDNVISCGSYTGNSSSQSISIGYEPQWILVKNITNVSDWQIIDVMRGMSYTSFSPLYANLSNAETTGTSYRFEPTATGWNLPNAGAATYNTTGNTYIYIAIRRGPMKTPTTGTSVFDAQTTASVSSITTTNFSVTVDAYLQANRNLTAVKALFPRLTQLGLLTYSTASESSAGTLTANFGVSPQTSVERPVIGGTSTTGVLYGLVRAPGFFDVVCYTGTGSATTFSHNLGVVPEMMIVKARNSSSYDWGVYSATTGASNVLKLNLTDASTANSFYFNGTTPTASVFSLGTSGATNGSGTTYVNYLFATVAGVSKVGSYTGTGTTLQINCGFTAGARFVMIKRTDSTGDWYVWDSARGIVAGNDPYLLLNSTAAEVTSTDYVDTYSAGFEISSTAPAAINANGGSFIFLAIA